ncbi:MAG: PsiF family protein [Proteobacteria bacterium]|nr:PsiF family protein [Pseudomonadota bacterium]
MKFQWSSKLAVLAVLGMMAWPLAAQETQRTAQQERMASCNQQAGDKKGDERKAFMKQCLSTKTASQKPTNQKEKMKYCNQQASEKKGDERKAFMRECLKADKKAA